MTCLIKLRENVKLHMMSSFFFSNNFSTLPNDKIGGRSKLEAFPEKFKLRHTLFFVMIGWKTFKKKKRKLLLNSIFFFTLNVFSKPSVINQPHFLKSKAFQCHVSRTFSGSRSKTAGKMHKLENRTGLILKYQYFAQRIELQSVQG